MTARRTKGDGGLTQRKDGRWQATLSAPLPGGGYKRVTFYGKTMAEAKRKLDKARRERDKGVLVATSPTLGKYLEDWLPRRRPNPGQAFVKGKHLKPNTWNGYESKIRLYIAPSPLAARRMVDLKPRQIEDFYDTLRLRGLSESTVRQTHMILQKVLGDAVREELLGTSPMARVVPPSTYTADREQWTLAQATHMLDAAGDSARWWLAIFYGARQGEVLGMDWEYVDWNRHTFQIEDAASNDYGYAGRILVDPKARASKRTLPMLPQIEVRLRLLWENAGRPASGLIFPNRVGRLMDSKRDWLNWRTFIDSATVIPFEPVPYIALHATRNTAASLMEAAGIPDRVVAQILGQATVQITHGYQNAEIARMRAELERAEALVTRTPEPPRIELGGSPSIDE